MKFALALSVSAYIATASKLEAEAAQPDWSGKPNFSIGGHY